MLAFRSNRPVLLTDSVRWMEIISCDCSPISHLYSQGGGASTREDLNSREWNTFHFSGFLSMKLLTSGQIRRLFEEINGNTGSAEITKAFLLENFESWRKPVELGEQLASWDFLSLKSGLSLILII